MFLCITWDSNIAMKQGSFSPPHLGGKRQNQRYFPPILSPPGGEIWVISPPFWEPLGGKFQLFPPQMGGGKPYDFGADFPCHLGSNKGKCSILIVNLPFWYSTFQNFRLRRYLGIVVQNRARLRRFTITLRQFNNTMFDWRKIVIVLHHKHNFANVCGALRSPYVNSTIASLIDVT